MSGLGLLNVEMESAALFVVARQRGLRAGMVCAVSSNLVEGASVYDSHDRLAAGWHQSIEVALRTAVALVAVTDGDLRPTVGLNLHTHLEGSIRPQTAAELAEAHGMPAPPGGWEDALRMREAGTLTTFLAHVAAAYPLFATPDAIGRIVTEAVEDAASDGVAYLELRFGPATHAGQLSIDAVIAAAADGLSEGIRRSGMPAGLVACALRHHDPATNEEVARAAAAARGPRHRRIRRGRGRAPLPLAGADGAALPHRRGGRARPDRARRGGRNRRARPRCGRTARCPSHRPRDPRSGLRRSDPLGGGRGHLLRAVPDLERSHRRRAFIPGAPDPPVPRGWMRCRDRRRRSDDDWRAALGGVRASRRASGPGARGDLPHPLDVADASLLRGLDARRAPRSTRGGGLGRGAHAQG